MRRYPTTPPCIPLDHREDGPVGIEVVVRRTWDVANGQLNCEFDVSNPDCVLFDERRIIPIVVNDTRPILLARSQALAPAGEAITVDTPVTHLARFYDYEPLEGAAVGMTKARVTRGANKPRELVRGPMLR